ncbi:MAG TPA: SRPBCC family protein [Kofleriaceae bacterium]|nr:SRPBCC family protein [Kofleriaceae bacterium]
MPQVVIDIGRPPEECWAALVDASRFGAWMPGLRKAEILSRHPDGLAHEVAFEFPRLTYSLVYTYDPARREVRWEPQAGAREAVRGFARIEPHGAGTRMTYKLEQGAGRKSGDLAVGGVHPIIDAFVRWIEARGDR